MLEALKHLIELITTNKEKGKCSTVGGEVVEEENIRFSYKPSLRRFNSYGKKSSRSFFLQEKKSSQNYGGTYIMRSGRGKG